jgi:hypothetical protein
VIWLCDLFFYIFSIKIYGFTLQKNKLMNYLVILKLYSVGDILQASEDQDTSCILNEATQAMETEISMWI